MPLTEDYIPIPGKMYSLRTRFVWSKPFEKEESEIAAAQVEAGDTCLVLEIDGYTEEAKVLLKSGQIGYVYFAGLDAME